MLVAFDNKIAHMLSNKILSSIASELFIRDKTKHFSCFYYRILFLCTKTSQTKFYTQFHYGNSKQKRALANRIQLFIKFWLSRLYEFFKKCTAKPDSFIVIDATLASDNSLRFR